MWHDNMSVHLGLGLNSTSVVCVKYGLVESRREEDIKLTHTLEFLLTKIVIWLMQY